MIVGFCTSHKVNNILLQPGKFADTRAVLSPKRSRRSVKLSERAIIRTYIAGKRIGSEPISFLRMIEENL